MVQRNSAEFLAEAMRQVRQQGWELVNLDAVILAQRPKMSPHIDSIRSRIAAIMSVDVSQIGLKAKTGEHVGEIGDVFEDAVADAYFASRARDSRLGAWASSQSRPLDDRATFETRLEEYRAKFERQAIPRPPHWTGFCVSPQQMEFWEDRDNRLHHRRQFVLENGQWTEGLLYP